MLPKPSIGIYIGAFDPVHSGHLSFALQVSQQLQLDSVYFLPERHPVDRPDITHHTHRVAMLRRAIKPYEQLGVVEVVDRRFSFTKTLPTMRHQFRGADILLILDVAHFLSLIENLPNPLTKHQLPPCIVSVRNSAEADHVSEVMQQYALTSEDITIMQSTRPEVSARHVRGAIALGVWAKGVLPSVRRYAREAWLYVRMPR